VIIVNATVVPGDGETVLKEHSVVIENGMIQEVVNQKVLPYDTADEIIYADGKLVIPGIINIHSHGGVIGGPINLASVPVPPRRVIYNLNRHMLQGTTTVINACGWATMAEVELTNKIHPMNIRASTNHAATAIRHALATDGKGLKAWHKNMTAREMIERGAVAVGETGAAFAAHATPQISEELGIPLSVPQVHRLKEAALGPKIDPSAFDEGKVMSALKEAKIHDILDVEGVRGIMERHWLAPYEMSRDSVEELSERAIEYDMPVLFHNTLESMELCLGVAPKLGSRLIALHTNYTFSPAEAVDCAKELKRHGALIDVFTADAYGVRMFHKCPDVSMALFKEGLVDLVSTDYIAGYWDPIPLIMEKAVEAGFLTMPMAVRKMTRDVVEAIPRIGSDRGSITTGKAADLAIVDPNNISQVQTVMIGGRVVVRDGKVCYPEGSF
jgi:alpha-D-ribose 1-methylphosphonate 5-triphosphate diphosphatase PhnM